MAIHVHNMSINKKVARQFLKGKRKIRVHLGTRLLGLSQPGCSYCEANVKVAQAERFHRISHEDGHNGILLLKEWTLHYSGSHVA